MKRLDSNGSFVLLPWFLRGLVAVVFLLFFVKLFEIQIIKGGYYKNLSDGNRVRKVIIEAPRGKILDIEGKEIVTNKEELKEIVFDSKDGYKKIPATGEEKTKEIIKEYKRLYPFGVQSAHLMGYVGEVTEDEVGKIAAECPEKGVRTLGMVTGKAGLEKYYDCQLRGINGEELIEVNTRGHKVRTLGVKPAIPGKDVRTNIDLDLQIKVAGSMYGKVGSVVVTNTKGAVLSYFSSPSYDPEAFIDPLRQPEVRKLLSNEKLPLFDRVIQGTYHPGSTYKLLISLIGLEKKVIDENYLFNDEGFIKITSSYGDYTYNNWYYTQYGGKEGNINVVKALGRSTDTFFYKLGEMIGVDEMVNWSKRIGLDKKTGIDLPSEMVGLVPSPSWKEEVKGEKWYLGNTYHMAIGQGDLAVTPLAVNYLTNIIASNGKTCTPQVVGEKTCVDLKVNRKNIETVKKGMEMACATGGTAYPFFNFISKNYPQGSVVACKTGTAQTVGEDVTHAWFTMFFPSEKPELVITVFIEKGGEGSKEAAPVAKDIMDYYVSRPR